MAIDPNRVKEIFLEAAELSDEAAAYFRRKACEVQLQPTTDGVQAWNEAGGAVLGLFHITC